MTQIEKAPNGAMQGFQGSAANVGELAKHGGTASAIAREEAELKAAIVLARATPREELAAYRAIRKACQRPSFAAAAMYSFPRGNQQIVGPSVDLAREMARVWGNIDYGVRVVTEDETHIHLKGYAFDLETNARVTLEDKFRKLIQRKDKRTGETKWVTPDERDARELLNRRGAFLERNCILKLMPPDFIDDAMDEADATKAKSAKGELQADREGTVKKMVMAFDEVQVTPEMLSEYLGHAVDDVTDRELADLKAIFKSLRDGNSEREEYFVTKKAKVEDATPQQPAPDAKPAGDKLADKLRGEKAEPIPSEVSDADIDAAMQ
jgi:hypothetical protein